MRLERIELREVRLRLLHPFETSFGITQDRRILLVTAHMEGLEGIGEVTAGELPSYSEETTDTAWLMLSEVIASRVLGRNLTHPQDLEELLSPIRGHQMAKAGLETAVWDAFARAEGRSLADYLGNSRISVPVGVSVGIRPSPERLAVDVRALANLGYRRVKLKIAPGRDLDFVRAARKALPDTPLTADANSAYRLTDAEHLRRLDEFGLQYLEQPLAHDDLIDHGALARSISTPICLDESIHHVDDVRKAHQIGAAKVINLKLGRVGGHASALRIANVCRQYGLDLWCGGMLESGIGRAHNLAMQSHAAFTLASDTAPSGNYWDEDIIEPEIIMTDGMVTVPTGPGMGVNPRRDLIETLTTRVEILG